MPICWHSSQFIGQAKIGTLSQLGVANHRLNHLTAASRIGGGKSWSPAYQTYRTRSAWPRAAYTCSNRGVVFFLHRAAFADGLADQQRPRGDQRRELVERHRHRQRVIEHVRPHRGQRLAAPPPLGTAQCMPWWRKSETGPLATATLIRGSSAAAKIVLWPP